jgi:hypothetical protein
MGDSGSHAVSVQYALNAIDQQRCRMRGGHVNFLINAYRFVAKELLHFRLTGCVTVHKDLLLAQ